MYTIAFRPDRDLIDIRWTGLFDGPSVDAYAAELHRRFREEGFAPGYRLLMDMSGCTVQPVEAAAAINRRLGNFPRASRIAIVTTSAITRLQVRRFMTQPYLRIFECAATARDWLTADASIAA
ncbi:STAS/SEC14 domain-containing protein [Sphingomonas sp. RP10(2022)]|uniref:STAS/SEC14 domain-containing protein n=1 Tax=Sphingomonas liriopis TaxID=2949094 RepID=A0A9X2HQV7_9SPHN|nr:STAS/SEC14 domain-containing protein [Sphingomonas liriopis]MCP3735503.1 STAS/SEC14 domain-containing protein [Sphingomonas liriopis]